MPCQTAPRMAAAVRRLFARFRGEDVRDLETWFPRAWRREPDMPTAVAAFETALWDARARAMGLPLAVLWGGVLEGVKTLITVSAVAPEEVGRRTRAAFRRGFDVIKLKLNGRDPAGADHARLRAAQKASPRATFLVDANQSYAPAALEELLAQTRRDGIRVAAVEEPFRRRDWRSLAAFKPRPAVPVILDESIRTPADARTVAKKGLNVGVNIKLAKSGITRSREILSILSKRGRCPLAPMIGCMAESKIGLAASVHFACGTGLFDYADLDSDLLLKDTPGRAGYVRRGPWAVLPKNPAPGSGAGWAR